MSEYTTLGIISVAIVLLMATMFISARVHYSIKAIASIIVVVGAIYNWELFASVLGYPIAERPPNNSPIVYTLTKKEDKKIYVVVDGVVPRTYTIPYSEPFDKKLEQAKKQLDPKQGRMIYKIKMNIKGKGTSKNAKGKNVQGQESSDGKEGADGNNQEDSSLIGKAKDKAKEMIKQLKTTLNISEGETDAEDDLLDSEGKKGKNKDLAKSAKGDNDFQDDETVPDDIEIESILPRK